MTLSSLACFGALLFLACGGALFGGTTYTTTAYPGGPFIHYFGVPTATQANLLPVGITDSGVTYGNHMPDFRVFGTQGFTASNGTVTYLPLTYTSFEAVSSNGQYLTGILQNNTPYGYGFYVKSGNGPNVDTGLLAYVNSGTYTAAPDYAPAGLNNNGSVVGTVYTMIVNGGMTSEKQSGFTYQNGGVTPFSDPALEFSGFTGINNQGEILGSGFNTGSSGEVSFTFENGVYTLLPGGFSATSVNDSGSFRVNSVDRPVA